MHRRFVFFCSILSKIYTLLLFPPIFLIFPYVPNMVPWRFLFVASTGIRPAIDRSSREIRCWSLSASQRQSSPLFRSRMVTMELHAWFGSCRRWHQEALCSLCLLDADVQVDVSCNVMICHVWCESVIF